METSQEIADIITGWFVAAQNGDAGWRDRFVSESPDLRIIGTDPDEWLKGTDAYAFLRNEAATIGGRVSIRVREVEGYREGSVGWGSALPEITLQDGAVVTPRWSAVFRLEGGGWKLVHLHASVAIGNEAAFGQTFAPG